MNFYYASLDVGERISRLADPEHLQWHTGALSVLFDTMPDTPCYIDASEGPSYFEKYHIPILHDASGPRVLMNQQVRTPISQIGRESQLFRYLLETNESKNQASEWLVYFDKPVVMWFCRSGELAQLSSTVFEQRKHEVSYPTPSDPILAIMYNWDSPVMEILSMQSLDISPLLRYGWRRRRRFFRWGKRLPMFSKLYSLDFARNGICL